MSKWIIRVRLTIKRLVYLIILTWRLWVVWERGGVSKNKGQRPAHLRRAALKM